MRLIEIGASQSVGIFGLHLQLVDTARVQTFYLMRKQAQELIPLLQHFADTGELPIDDPTAPLIWKVIEEFGESIPEIEWDKRKQKQTISDATKQAGGDDNAH